MRVFNCCRPWNNPFFIIYDPINQNKRRETSQQKLKQQRQPQHEQQKCWLQPERERDRDRDSRMYIQTYTYIKELLIFKIQFYTLLTLITIGSIEYSPPAPVPVPVHTSFLLPWPDWWWWWFASYATPVLIGV